MKRIIFSTLITILSLQIGSAQPLKAWVEAADTAYVHKDYYPAFKYYEIALEYDSSRMDVWYKYAEAARQFNAYVWAEDGYKRVLGSEESAAYPLCSYWLASVQQTLGRYEQAKVQYQNFLDSQPNADAEKRAMAEKGINNCDWALEMSAEPKEVTITALDSTVNSPYSDFGAFEMDNQLYYTSFQFVDKKDENIPPRIFNKILVSTEGNAGIPLPDNVNEAGKHVAHTAFNEDFSEMYYTVCEYTDIADIRCDIYSRERSTEGVWGPATKLKINKAGFTSTHPSIGVDYNSGKEVLFFTSDRPDGKGGLDIWCSEVDAAGELSPPFNVSEINTSEDDITPFFHTRSQTLYFSSDGHPVFGGYDIFKIKKTGYGWESPENLGLPINSSFNDMYYSLNERGSKAYLSSNRPGATFLEKEKEACCNDLFKHDVDITIDLLALTFDNATKLDLDNATVELYEIDEYGNEKLIATLTNPDGNDFSYPLEMYKAYKIVAKKEGYYPITEMLDLNDPSLDGSQTIERKLYLDPEQILLQALTIEAEDRDPIFGATVKLMELVDYTPKLIEEKTNENGNDFIFPLEIGKKYLLSASKIGFDSRTDTIMFSKEDIEELGNKVTVEIPLRRINFDDFLPLALYFDNDMPDRGSYYEQTKAEYSKLNEGYYSKKEEFITEFTEGLPENDKFLTGEIFENFFEREVRGGQRDLNGFTKKLKSFLEKGNSIQITIKGYASPRASADYNKRLSRRRVESLKNHFRNYGDGIFQIFLQNGQLAIEEEAYGEETAKEDISDKLDDTKNSIYSILASVERRVEIVEAKTERLDKNQDKGE